MPLTIVWAALAGVFLWASLANGGPALFIAFGFVAVGIGGYVLLNRRSLEANVRARTAYGLTNRRVIMIGGSPHRVRSVLLHELPAVTLQAESDEIGTVWFVPDDPISRLADWPFKTGVSGGEVYHCFECIESPEKVLQLVREAEAQAWAEIRSRSRPTYP